MKISGIGIKLDPGVDRPNQVSATSDIVNTEAGVSHSGSSGISHQAPYDFGQYRNWDLNKYTESDHKTSHGCQNEKQAVFSNSGKTAEHRIGTWFIGIHGHAGYETTVMNLSDGTNPLHEDSPASSTEKTWSDATKTIRNLARQKFTNIVYETRPVTEMLEVRKPDPSTGSPGIYSRDIKSRSDEQYKLTFTLAPKNGGESYIKIESDSLTIQLMIDKHLHDLLKEKGLISGDLAETIRLYTPES